jgi:transcriptional regulator PpsR
MRPQGDATWTVGLIPMIEPEVVTEIISNISDVALIISKKGQVLGVMASPGFMPHSGLGTWEGRMLDEELTVESLPKFRQRLAEFIADKDTVLPVELNHVARNGQPEFPIRYSFHKIGTDGALLMLGRDLRPIAEMQQQLVAAQIALEKDYEAQREYDTRFRVLMSVNAEPTVFVRVSDGKITDTNPAGAVFFDTAEKNLVGQSFSDLFQGKQAAHLISNLTESASAEAPSPLDAVSIAKRGNVTITPKLFRSGGEHMLLCRMSQKDEDGPQTNALQDKLDALYKNGVEGIVFVTGNGTILSANSAFMNLSDVTHTGSIQGRSIADFLSRGSVDLNVLLDNATRAGAMRLYATQLVSEHGTERPIEISTTRLQAQDATIFALIFRDANRIEGLRAPAAQLTEVDRKSVVELIGSQALKDIVAKTTDVVEKMCIETAVELTSNNRVAAAEMLGLSRQSLYVKLRKYDLL